MTGTSYNGSLPLIASTTGNDALKAIAPMAPVSSFTHYLFGVDNGAQDDLGVRIQKQDGSWFDDEAWPAKTADAVRFFAAAGGAAQGSLQPLSRDGLVASEPLVDDSSISLNDLVAADASTHRLLYSTGALSDELRISGTATAQLSVAIDKPAANITMALVDVAPDGSRHLITRAWTDPQNRIDIRTTEAVVPGQTYDLALSFVPTDYRIAAGHALGVTVASSETDTSLLPEPGTTLTVDTSQTFVDVPVAGGEQQASTLFGDIAHPALSVTAATIREGEQQTVSGAGFVPGVDLTVSTDAGGAAPVTVRTSAEGTFDATFALPTGSAGERTVVASAGRAEVARAVSTVEAAPTPTPAPSPTPTPSPSSSTGPGAGAGTGGAGATPTSAPATGSPAGALAATGTDAAPTGPVTAALLLLGGGAALMVVRRARTARRTAPRR